MSVSATYSSSMFGADGDYYETVSIDLSDSSKNGFDQILITRRVEKVCFQYDDSGAHLLEPSEWEVLSFEKLGWHRLSAVMNAINKKTAELVQKYDVLDVSRTNPSVLQAKIAHGIPFGEEGKFENLLDHKQMASFENLLTSSLGDKYAKKVMDHFSSKYKLPVKLAVEMNEIQSEEQYASWGAWA